MKHLFKFTHVLAVAFAAVMMLGFSACNDEIGDRVAELTNENTNLEEELTATTDSLKDQIADLQNQVNTLANMHSCDCEIKTADQVAAIIHDSLVNYWTINDGKTFVGDTLASYWTINNVQNFVDTTLNNYVTLITFNNAITTLTNAVSAVNDSINAHRTDIKGLRHDVDTLKWKVGDLYTLYANLHDSVILAWNTANAALTLARQDSALIDALGDSIADHRAVLDAIQATVDGLAGRMTTAENNITALDGRVTTLEGQITVAIDSAAAAYALAVRDSIRIDALEQAYTLIQQDITNLQAEDTELHRQIDSIKIAILDFATHAEVNAVKAHADSLYDKALHYADSLHDIVMDTLNTFDARITTLETILPIVRDSVQLLNDSLVALQAEVATVKAQVEENTRKIDALTATVNDVFSKQIYGVVVQGTYNPVFGYFALPFGVQSNMLIAYYGHNEHITYFPTVSTADLVYEQYALTDDDAAILGGTVDSWSVAGGTTFIAEGANAGKLYFNVNPSSADLTDATFSLVNTADGEAGIRLDTIKPSTEVLTFGYTGPTNRASVNGHSNNGFYEAAAMLDEDGINVAKISLDPELKQAVKDFYNTNIKDKSAREAATGLSGSSLGELAYGLYQQINGLMPRYAVKAAWTDSLGDHSVYSSAEVAATAVKPLSYAFFKDHSMKKLPTISPLSDLSDFTIDLSNIHFNVNFNLGNANTHITLDPITINFDEVALYAVVSMPDLDAFKISNDPADITQQNETIYVELDSLEAYLNRRFAAVTGQWNDSINAAIDGQVNTLITEINTQVQNFASDIEGQLNTQIQKVVDDAKDKVMNKFNGYLNKLNKFINKMNSLINRVNNKVLDNPNKFLQTVLAYEGADNKFHLMSTSKAVPSVFRGSGAIVLYPTSYNAEIAAPAYKKFIAVTNVYKGAASAQDDAACLSALNAANSRPNFNEVMDGGRYGVAFVGQAGYTYEIFYSALDYSGKISQRKYYVTVK